MTTRLRALLIPFCAAVAIVASGPPSALASIHQVSLVLDNPALNANPEKTLTKLKAMGVTMVKYAVYWRIYAPDERSPTAPAGAASPGLYEARDQLGGLDEIDRDAAALGIKVGLMVTSPAPRWAEASGGTAAEEAAGTYKPSDADYRAFVEALGRRYSGADVPAGATTPLPAVTWWSVWNEPNYVPNLSPQTVSHSTYEAADTYRGLVNAAYEGLKRTGHSGDTFLFGELAPRGISGTRAGNAAGIKPIQFLASLYCVTTRGQRLGGRRGSANGCPGHPSAFRRANPGLFNASGVADHPYSQGVAPDVRTHDCTISGQPLFCEDTTTGRSDRLWTDLASISDLETSLARDLRVYGSERKFAIWNTEFGYWTDPPGTRPCHGAAPSYCDLAPAAAALYENWSEYISYRNPRIASFAQYQLYEPASGSWVDGLLSRHGQPEPAYRAFEVPLFIPTSVARTAGRLTVWGGVRSAAVLQASQGIAPTVEVQFRASSGSWRTLRTVTVSGIGGYFTTSVNVGQSGSVRLVDPSGSTPLISRTQAITVR